jgi:hypothetical protein
MDKVRKKDLPKPPERLDETNTNILRKKTGGESRPKQDPKAPSQ